MPANAGPCYERGELLAVVMCLLSGKILDAEDRVTSVRSVNSEPLAAPKTRNQTIDSILKERKELIERLIPLVDPENAKQQEYRTRAAAAYLLGQLRSVEAVPVLVRALADERIYFGEEIDRMTRPVFGALCEIGRPAVPELLRQVQSTDDPTARMNGLEVLRDTLGGKRRLLDVLRKVEQSSSPEAAPRVRSTIEFVETKLKEVKEPLF